MSDTEQQAAPAEDNAAAKEIDVLSIGNAMIDILVKADNSFLESLGLKKGSMSLIDKEKSAQLFSLFESVEKSSSATINEMSGGCAANVAAAMSSFGGKAAFLGKIGKDTAGEHFIEKLKEREIDVSCSPVIEGGETGRCLVVVSESGARTMCTYLGSAQEIGKDDINEDIIAKSKIVFLSAFLWDCKTGNATAMAVVNMAKKHGTKVALTLSDYLCVERHIDELMNAVDHQVDILFANKSEINALFQVEDHSESVKLMAAKYAGTDKIAALTRSEDGVVIINKEAPISIDGMPVSDIKDTTGAGAVFVAGFLYGQTHDLDLEKSASLGNLAAAECLSHLGARPLIELKTLIPKVGG